MKLRPLLITPFLLLVASLAQGQIIIGSSFNSLNVQTEPDFLAANLSVVQTITGTATQSNFSFSGTTGDRSLQLTGSSPRVFSWDITVASGYLMNLNSFSLIAAGQTAGSGYSYSVAINDATVSSGALAQVNSWTSVSPTLTGFQNLTGTVTIEFRGTQAITNRAVYLDEFTFQGNVAVIPEPAYTSLLVALGVGALIGLRRRARRAPSATHTT